MSATDFARAAGMALLVLVIDVAIASVGFQGFFTDDFAMTIAIKMIGAHTGAAMGIREGQPPNASTSG